MELDVAVTGLLELVGEVVVAERDQLKVVHIGLTFFVHLRGFLERTVFKKKKTTPTLFLKRHSMTSP